MSKLFVGWNEHILSVRAKRAFVSAVRKLAEPGLWRLFHITNESAQYERLALRESFIFPASSPPSIYVAAFHAFRQLLREGELHNHRFPGLILPFAKGAAPGTPLYEMPWEIRAGDLILHAGTHTVVAGEPYGMTDALNVWHAVYGIRPHMSFVFTDTTEGPQRENRLTFDERSADEVQLFCEELREALLCPSTIGA